MLKLKNWCLTGLQIIIIIFYNNYIIDHFKLLLVIKFWTRSSDTLNVTRRVQFQLNCWSCWYTLQCACTLIFEFWWQLNQVDADSTYIFYYYFVLCIGYYLPHVEAKLHRKGYTANFVSKSQLWYVILWCAKLYDPVKKKRKLFLYPIHSTKLLINVWLLIPRSSICYL